MFSLTKTTSRQGEILEVLFRNGWDYMRGVLTGTRRNDEPKLPTPEVLRNILIELGPVYVKLGQLLSTRPDLLPGSYIEALTGLQANVPPVDWPAVRELIRQELGRPIEEVFSNIIPRAIAAGSIAQTHKAILKNGQQVALKVQRPGIDVLVEQDLLLIRAIAELMALTDFGKDYDVVGLAEEFTTAILAELDFTQEGRYANQLRRNLAATKWFDPTQLLVPEIYWEYTSQKILVLEWLEGVPLLLGEVRSNNPTVSVSDRRRELTRILFRAFFQQIYIDGFFHADPHPGNLFYLTDGRVAILDCGMMGRLDPRSQTILTEMLLAVVDLDAVRLAQLTVQLSDTAQAEKLSNLENDLAKMLRKYYNMSLSQLNFSQVFYELLQVARANKIKLPSNMGLYAKAIANLEGVARQFDPEVNLLDEVKPLMTDLFRRQLFGDDPMQTLLRTALDLKSLSLQSPRQVELLLESVTSETLRWNLTLKDLDGVRRSMDDSANRLSFSIVVGSLIIGAAITFSNGGTQMAFVGSLLFYAASFLGLWLIVSILRSGRLR